MAALEQLELERAAVARQVRVLAAQFDGIVESAELVATDDEHDPEGHTIAYERQQVAALLSNARLHLADIDAALDRVGDSTYGLCIECGGVIAPERLAALPAAGRCITCAESNPMR